MWVTKKRVEPMVAEGKKVVEKARDGLTAIVALLGLILGVSLLTLAAVLNG